MRRRPTPGIEMALIPVLTALLLAGWTVYCLYTFSVQEMSQYRLQSNPEVLLLVCPVSLFGIIASLVTYRIWWRDRSYSYSLLALMHILVLTGGAILGWVLAGMLATGQSF